MEEPYPVATPWKAPGPESTLNQKSTLSPETVVSPDSVSPSMVHLEMAATNFVPDMDFSVSNAGPDDRTLLGAPEARNAALTSNDAVANLPQFSESELLMIADKKINKKPEARLDWSERIVSAAESMQGKQLWYPDNAEITKNGSLGCAIAVVKVLQKAGYKVDDHTGVRNLENALGWDRINDLSKAQPGDLAVGHSKSGGNHIGIVGRYGGVWNNSVRAVPPNIWVNETMTVGLRPAWLFNGYDERYLLRPPKK